MELAAAVERERPREIDELCLDGADMEPAAVSWVGFVMGGSYRCMLSGPDSGL